jgi:hypothetical protein
MPIFFSWPIEPTPPYVSPETQVSGAADAGAVAPRDEALDPFDGDQLIEDGDQTLLFDQAGVLSDLKARWQVVKGEWYLDTSIGIDWFGIVLVKNPNLAAIREEFTRVALETPGVTEMVTFDMILDKRTRELNVNFQFIDNLGNVISDSLALVPVGTQ